MTNIEGLAHHDLIDLILETRIPVPRLVDWVDQAILYLHLAHEEEPKGTKTASAGQTQPGVEKPQDLRRCLREYGVRTATDLIRAWKKGEGKLATTLKQKKDEESFDRLQVVINAMKDDEWLNHIKHWRKNTRVEEVELIVPHQEDKEDKMSGEQPNAAVTEGAHPKEAPAAPVAVTSAPASVEGNGDKS